jgi:hypothetical protein
MHLSFTMSGAAPRIKKFQIGETFTAGVVGIPVEIPTLSDVDGVLMCETTSIVDALGVSVDNPGTRQTAQQSDGSDPARKISVIINPDAVYHARLSGGSTSGTALTTYSNTVASTTGLLTTLGLAAAYDDGYVCGYTGANAGVCRKVTAVAGTNETPIIAFPADIAVGDTFIANTFGGGEDAGATLTSNLDEIDSTADGQGTDNLRCISLYMFDQSGEGTTRSFAEVILIDHLYGGNIT